MFYLAKPDHRTIDLVLRSSIELTHDGSAAAGFNIDHNRILLGKDCFEAACQAIQQWKMFDIGWVNLCWSDSPIAVGVVVAPLIYHLGFCSLNPARIIAIIDEPRRFGFTYATLEGHAECGEEQFLLEWLENGEVWYDLYATSRPNHWLAWLGYPITRALQKRFAQDSMRAMRASVRPRALANPDAAGSDQSTAS